MSLDKTVPNDASSRIRVSVDARAKVHMGRLASAVVTKREVVQRRPMMALGALQYMFHVRIVWLGGICRTGFGRSYRPRLLRVPSVGDATCKPGSAVIRRCEGVGWLTGESPQAQAVVDRTRRTDL
ncbi:hypothetical protein DOTSEDRAFT_69353 [Dothistroma septosporum NZE10]|uniref:Uncharacterized protein n=1 Tax=Dothistroma septosporum (strain NZE10 / CBS 128990) TaxID=675120 RepID=N1PVI4_DOTSN|nr:hypothetical protein DOTSEDRAFT_69353 [Dothistroma septosporum NZE10]